MTTLYAVSYARPLSTRATRFRVDITASKYSRPTADADAKEDPAWLRSPGTSWLPAAKIGPWTFSTDKRPVLLEYRSQAFAWSGASGLIRVHGTECPATFTRRE